MTPAGFPHSDTLGSQLGRQLPEAYRSPLRPSSAPGAKASTVRSSLLTTKMLASTVQFSNNTQTTTYTLTPTPTKVDRYDNCSHLSLLPREETLACSLRTQQYADILFRRPPTEEKPYDDQVCQRPPMSSRRTTSGSETGSANQPSTCVDVALENAP